MPTTEELWKTEQDFARKFLYRSVKPTGEIEFVDDGKNDVLLRMTMANMVTLLATYGIERIAHIVEETANANNH